MRKGKIPNAGRPNDPKILRRDLPRTNPRDRLTRDNMVSLFDDHVLHVGIQHPHAVGTSKHDDTRSRSSQVSGLGRAGVYVNRVHDSIEGRQGGGQENEPARLGRGAVDSSGSFHPSVTHALVWVAV